LRSSQLARAYYESSASITTGRPRTLRMGSTRTRATASNRPAAGYGTTIVIGPVGYVCPPAIPETVGSAGCKAQKILRGHLDGHAPDCTTALRENAAVYPSKIDRRMAELGHPRPGGRYHTSPGKRPLAIEMRSVAERH
jgi:hypothetical protein